MKKKKEEFKTKLVPIISSARAASVIAKKWESKTGLLPDAFVVEGPKAGGHLGYKYEEITDPNHSLEHIVPEVVETVKALEDKKTSKFRLLPAAGFTPAKTLRISWRLALPAYKWAHVLLQPTNAMRI